MSCKAFALLALLALLVTSPALAADSWFVSGRLQGCVPDAHRMELRSTGIVESVSLVLVASEGRIAVLWLAGDAQVPYCQTLQGQKGAVVTASGKLDGYRVAGTWTAAPMIVNLSVTVQ